jgi:hypothetical protein
MGLARHPPGRSSKKAELAVTYETAERVLNHAMGKLERVYNRHGYR